MAGSGGCEALLFKRKALLNLVGLCPVLQPWNQKRFWDAKLPRLLAAENRLFPPVKVLPPNDLSDFQKKTAVDLKEFLKNAPAAAVELLCYTRADDVQEHHRI